MSASEWRPNASRQTLAKRAQFFARIRQFFADRDVLEVDTPVISQGVASEPQLASFRLENCESRALITSPEFAMKRLLAAGSGAIYRLGPAFRGDEAGRWHNPEFCMLEWYRPGFDAAALRREIAALLKVLVPEVEDVRTLTVAQIFEQAAGLDPHTASDAQLRDAAVQRGWAPPENPSQTEPRSYWLDLIIGIGVSELLADAKPVFLIDYPACMAGLTEVRYEAPAVAQRFELYWRGQEIANGGTELIDPARVRSAFESDKLQRRANGESVAVGDERLLSAQEHGLPECAGVALGVDRLLALALGFDSIAPVLPFAWDRA